MVFVELDLSVHISYKLVLHRPEFPYKKEFLLDGIQSDLLKNTYVGLTKRIWKYNMIPWNGYNTLGS